jgi:hypothetical protein
MKKTMSLVAILALFAQMMMPWVSYANEIPQEERTPPTEAVVETIPTESVAPDTG